MEAFAQLEEKVEATIEALEIYRMEIEELRHSKETYENEINQLKASSDLLKTENNKLEADKQSWNKKIATLISKLESISESEPI